jgi:hypothetical protein
MRAPIIPWTQLIFNPSPKVTKAINADWRWLVPKSMTARAWSAVGDVFFEDADGSVHWLDTGMGTLERVAPHRDAFRLRLEADGGEEILLPAVVQGTIALGLAIEPGQCLGFTQLPILGGTYLPENRFPIDAAQWMGFAGTVHKQLAELPDGTQVRLSFE